MKWPRDHALCPRLKLWNSIILQHILILMWSLIIIVVLEKKIFFYHFFSLSIYIISLIIPPYLYFKYKWQKVYKNWARSFLNMAHIPYSLRTLQKWPYHLRHAHAFVHACWIKLNICWQMSQGLDTTSMFFFKILSIKYEKSIYKTKCFNATKNCK